jgi:hypothetical protein
MFRSLAEESFEYPFPYVVTVDGLDGEWSTMLAAISNIGQMKGNTDKIIRLVRQ